MPDIDIDHVRKLDGRLLLVFSELLKRRSVTATAAHLHLSQSAVSHALSRLRSIHDDPLFTRKPHGLEPTARAEALGPAVTQLIELADLLHGGVREWDPVTSERKFNIAAPEFVVADLGADLLTRWSRTAPGISVVTHQLDHDDVARQLARGDLDLAVGRFRNRQPAALQRETLYTDDYCVVAKGSHREVSDEMTLAQYQSLNHIIAGSASEGDEHETIPKGLHVRAVVPGWLTALTLVSASDAIATCPRRLAKRHAKRLRLRILDLPSKPMPIEVTLLHRNEQPTPPLAWLIDEVRQSAVLEP